MVEKLKAEIASLRASKDAETKKANEEQQVATPGLCISAPEIDHRATPTKPRVHVLLPAHETTREELKRNSASISGDIGFEWYTSMCDNMVGDGGGQFEQDTPRDAKARRKNTAKGKFMTSPSSSQIQDGYGYKFTGPALNMPVKPNI